eukprot:TRINITY_DN20520_c1_g1_i1.p1 TRINITY_DN20520_c1_g1~~TRINITY_DN20520_c1_g1_i1.p1  ORF type:complete len:324 (+),score=137.03 TRINITY_DN20520_c1_g1_i1:59-1030(+)
MPAGVRYEEGSFESPVDKLKVFVRSWVPEGRAKAVVVMSHGYMEHCGRYERFATALVNSGYACYALDHRSHGKSQDYKATRALMKRFQDIVDDFNAFVNYVLGATASTEAQVEDGVPSITTKPLASILGSKAAEVKAPAVPFFVFAHSMGALAATKYMLDYGNSKPIKGLVLSAPYLLNHDPPGCFMRGVLGCVASLAPSTGVAAIKDGVISRDKDEDKKYNEDPLNTRTSVPAGSVHTFIQTHEEVVRRAKDFTAPFFLVHGSVDKLVDIKGSNTFMKLVTSEDKMMKVYDGGYHELLNELPEMRDQVTRDIIAWLDQRAKL